MTREDLEKKIRAIIFDDEFEILGKVKWQNDKAVGPQVEQFKVDSLIALFQKETQNELEKQTNVYIGFTMPKDFTWENAVRGFSNGLYREIMKLGHA